MFANDERNFSNQYIHFFFRINGFSRTTSHFACHTHFFGFQFFFLTTNFSIKCFQIVVEIQEYDVSDKVK